MLPRLYASWWCPFANRATLGEFSIDSILLVPRFDWLSPKTNQCIILKTHLSLSFERNQRWCTLWISWNYAIQAWTTIYGSFPKGLWDDTKISGVLNGRTNAVLNVSFLNFTITSFLEYFLHNLMVKIPTYLKQDLNYNCFLIKYETTSSHNVAFSSLKV